MPSPRQDQIQKLARELAKLSPDERTAIQEKIKDARRSEATGWIVRGALMTGILLWGLWYSAHETGKDPMSWIDWAGLAVFVALGLGSIALGIIGHYYYRR